MTPARRWWVIGVAVAVVVIAGVAMWMVWQVHQMAQPVYVRQAKIESVKWGKDGSLYLRVWWSIIRLHENWEEGVFAFSQPAVYRLDPNERVVRRVPDAEETIINARWKESYWIGGRYGIGEQTVGDTLLSYVPDEAKGGRWTYSETSHIRGESRPVVYPISRVTGQYLIDWVSGETVPLNEQVVAMSPNDDYYLYVNRSDRLPYIRWLKTKTDSAIPKRILESRQYLLDKRESWPQNPEYRLFSMVNENLVTGEIKIEKTIQASWRELLGWAGNETTARQKQILLPYHNLYSTTSGLLDPARQLLIDPVTWETGAGWDPFAGTR